MFSAFRTFGALGSQRGVFDVVSLFRAGEQGVWYDPSDTTTLFQDSVGTIPVTAAGQPVGLMLDKRLGLVRGPDSRDTGAPSAFGTPPSAATYNAAGEGTASRIDGSNFSYVTFTGVTIGKSYEITVRNSGGSNLSVRTSSIGTVLFTVPAGATLTGRVVPAGLGALSVAPDTNGSSISFTVLSVRELPGNHATQPTAASRPIYRRGDSRGVVNQLLNTETLATQSRAVTAVGHTLSFTGTGSITLSGASAAGPLVGTGVNDRVSLTFTPTAGSMTLTVSGSVTKGQLNLGPTALPYQRNDSHLGGVATGASTDLHWLETDGVDDGMVTASINFTGTDKVSVFAGVRKLSDAATGVLAETGAGGLASSFAVFAPISAAPTFSFRSVGSAQGNVQSAANFTAPVSAVLSGVGDIAGDVCSLRTNGGTKIVSATDQGTGNFGNYPLYLFRRAGTILPFNGWFYGMAITGRLTTDAETVATERFLATKSAVVIP